MNTTYDNGSRSGNHSSAWIRPAWKPVTIAIMIIGFMIFWPLGLAMLAYILWGDRLNDLKSSINRETDGFARKWSRDCGTGNSSNRSTGNVAFDDWRKEEIERLRKERRALEEMRNEFENHLHELRRAKDQDEFDAFMASYKANTQKGKKNKPPKSVPDSK